MNANSQNAGFTRDSQKEMILFNIVEEMVKETIDRIIPTMDMCSCSICRLNACAIALNHLMPHYVTTTKGRELAKISAERMNYQTKVLVETTKALLLVKENPLH